MLVLFVGVAAQVCWCCWWARPCEVLALSKGPVVPARRSCRYVRLLNCAGPASRGGSRRAPVLFKAARAMC